MKKTNRISRDEMYLRIAETVALRGTCNRLQVGAVIVKDNGIVSEGYVGAPTNLPHCIDVGCIEGKDGGCIRTVHAEANAIIKAAKYGKSTDGATMYCTHSPCSVCAAMMINAGIKRLVYRNRYRDEKPLDILSKVGITIVQKEKDSMS
jgi:dCMP deaminase